jgi:hypothetical protein
MMMEARYSRLTTNPALKTYIPQNVYNFPTLFGEFHQFKEENVDIN